MREAARQLGPGVYAGSGLVRIWAFIGILIAAPLVWILYHAFDVQPRSTRFTLLLRSGIAWQFDVLTLPGMLCVIGIYLAPYVMLIVSAALRGTDPSLEEAAHVCGFGIVAASIKGTILLLSPALT